MSRSTLGKHAGAFALVHDVVGAPAMGVAAGRREVADAMLADPFVPLGLHGLSAIANPVLAGLVTGDPVLLVGNHGTAKTALVEALAGALGMRFRAYDASKALFEDIIGFPNPRELGEGKVSYVPTEISIWGTEFVLVDELSRAAPSMQNKWLEVIRARRVMGLAVDSLRHVFAAMNPPGYLGARPLDPALAGRFGFIVQMPTVREMSAGEVGAVIRATAAADAPACPGVFEPGAEEDGRGAAGGAGGLVELVDRARAELPSIIERHGEAVVEYVRAFQAMLRPHNVDLDGRRLGLMYRGLCAAMAVDALGGAEIPSETGVYGTIRHLLPGPALDGPVSGTVLYPAHSAAWQRAFEGRGADDTTGDRHMAVCRVLARERLRELVRSYESNLDDLAEEDHHEVASRVLRPLGEESKAHGRPRERAEAVAALRALLGVVERRWDAIPLDVSSRVFEGWRAVSGMGSIGWDPLLDLACEDELDPSALGGNGAWLASPGAPDRTPAPPGAPDESVDSEQAAGRWKTVADALRDNGEVRP